jgi:hypothetical protein
VPVNAPAAPNLDVIVTNPAVTSPPAQQNQSGVLSPGLTINATSAFQNHYRFAALNNADDSIDIFDSGTRAMVNVPVVAYPLTRRSLAFNANGTYLYTSTQNGKMLAVNPATHGLTVIPLGGRTGTFQALCASVNPATGGSVMYEWNGSPLSDLVVNMVDANPSSPTFNTVIAAFNAGLNDTYNAVAGTCTPDGKYVYVDYSDHAFNPVAVAVFDIVHGGAATILTFTQLGISETQYSMFVTARETGCMPSTTLTIC